MLLFSLSCFFCLYHFILLSWLIYGARRLSRIEKKVSFSVTPQELPSLSIIVPARNEEKTLGVGLHSLIRLSYPKLKILVVNDRSTDKTAQVLIDFQKKDNRIQGITINTLPEGWLGKNHALFVGAKASCSEFILFTDADVEIDDTFLKQAVQFSVQNKLEHLAAIPRVIARSIWLYPLLGVFGLAFSLFTKPWQGKDPKKKQAVGIGAFNLVRKAAYDELEGHKKIALRPDDDLKLALIFKRSGFRTDCVSAVEGLRVEWYANFSQLMRGLEKNVMTGFEYSFVMAILGNLFFAFTFIVPFMLLGLTTGLSAVLNFMAVVFLLLAYGGQLFEARMPLWCIPFFPFAAVGMLFIFIRACWLTFQNQGVYWRDTYYSLDRLRSNRFD